MKEATTMRTTKRLSCIFLKTALFFSLLPLAVFASNIDHVKILSAGQAVERPFAGDLLSAEAVFTEGSGSARYRWFYATDAHGKVGRVNLGTGATQKAPDAAIDKFIFVEVTGIGGAAGSAVSKPVGPVYGPRTIVTLQNGVTPDYDGVKAVGEMTQITGTGGVGAAPIIRLQSGLDGLLYFPLTNTQDKKLIPDGAFITSSVLTLYIAMENVAWGTMSLRFYRILDPDGLGMWEEGTKDGWEGLAGPWQLRTDGSSFTHRNASKKIAWLSSNVFNGINFSCLPEHTKLFVKQTGGAGEPVGTPVVIDSLQADVQAWVDGEVNQGWWLRSAFGGGQTRYAFASPRNTVPAYRPKLAVEYYVTDKTEIEAATMTEESITLNWRPGKGVERYKVFWDKQPWGTAHARDVQGDKASCVIEKGLKYMDTYYFYIESYDAGGKLLSTSGSLPVQMLVDTTPPVTTVSIDGVHGKRNINYNPVTITPLSAADAKSGVDYTEYRINNTEWVKIDIGKSFTVTEHGVHDVKVRSVDKAGNVEDFHRFDVCIDESDLIVREPALNGKTLSVTLENKSDILVPVTMVASLNKKSDGSVLRILKSAPARMEAKGQYTLSVDVTSQYEPDDCYFEIFLWNSTDFKADKGAMQPLSQTLYYPKEMNPVSNASYYYIPLTVINK